MRATRSMVTVLLLGGVLSACTDGPSVDDEAPHTSSAPSAAEESAKLVVGRLRPAPETRACTMELGPRRVLVMEDGERRVGVVIDGYGCRDVRLTDDLAHTVPGDGRDGEVVAGVLSAPSGLGRRVARIVDEGAGARSR